MWMELLFLFVVVVLFVVGILVVLIIEFVVVLVVLVVLVVVVVAGRKQSFDGLRLEKDGLREKGGEIPVKREMKGHLKLRRRTRQIGLGRVGRDARVASKVDRVHPIDQR